MSWELILGFKMKTGESGINFRIKNEDWGVGINFRIKNEDWGVGISFRI